MNWRPPTLETKRLILRALQESDAAAIFAYAHKPEVARYTMWDEHKSIADSSAFIIDYAFASYAKECPEPFGIVDKSSGQLIGTVGCFMVKKHSMELAYALSPDFWGKDITVEAAKCVVDFCFRQYPIERMQCRCAASNLASERVMQKLGLQYEGTLRRETIRREEFWDMKYYSIMRNEWEN